MGREPDGVSLTGSCEEKPDQPSAPVVDWARVRALYEAGDVAVSRILTDFGLKARQLRNRRVAEGWATRPSAAPPGPAQGRRPPIPEAMKKRLAGLVAAEIARLERLVIKGEGLGDANVRLVLQLLRTVDQMSTDKFSRDTKSKADGKASGNDAAEAGAPANGLTKKKNNAGFQPTDDIAALRAELERRIARLRGPS